MTLLFNVENIFMVTGRGLTLVATLEDYKPKFSDLLIIVRPDRSIIETKIRGVGFGNPSTITSILVDEGLTKEDIPIGSEVWLEEQTI
jgi:hypothetical protein